MKLKDLDRPAGETPNRRESRKKKNRQAMLQTAEEIFLEKGYQATTIDEIAERAGVTKRTLYKYFPDVEAILAAWHERQISGHLQQLAATGHQAGNAADRLEAVLQTYALIQHGQQAHHGSDLAALLHRGEHVIRAQQQLHNFISNLLADGAKAGDLRDDVAPGELASYCLHALTAASSLPSKAAVHRLIAVTREGALSREHLVEYDAQRPDVGALVDALSAGLLRRHVGDRPYGRSHPRELIRPARPR